MEILYLGCCLIAGYVLILWIYSLRRRKNLSAHNKAVLITGCDSGFGYDLAVRLSQMGYHIFAGCLLIDGKGANALRSTPRIEVVQLDVTKEESISSAEKTIEEALGSKVLWAIVNNAGLPQIGEIEWCPMENMLRVFDVNTFGMVRVTKQFLPFIKNSKGRIVNVCSATANRRVPGCVGYSMSKAAAKSFSIGVRVEMLKWHIQVIEISPFFYRTPLVDANNTMKLLEDSWVNSDPQITSSLGKEYFKRYVKFVLRYLNVLCIPRREEVTECLVEAVTSPSPKVLYEPGNIINTIMLDFTEYLPYSLTDFLHSLFLPKLYVK